MNNMNLLWRKTGLVGAALLLVVSGMMACGGGSSGYGSTTSNSASSTISAPTGVTATAGSGQMTVSWTAVSGATSYNMYMATQTGVSKSNYSTKSYGMAHTGVTSPYAHTGLTAGTTYYLVVTAMDASGESADSSEAYATPM
ncbi:MAG: fibronectin type III domain-containing protein [Nitrospinae bacterium]|nr:fibronectin type III domain-containing protein [Nitrospinota bacterium]